MKRINPGIPINIIALVLGIFSCWLAYLVLRATDDPWAAFWTLCGCLWVFAYTLDKMVNEGD